MSTSKAEVDHRLKRAERHLPRAPAKVMRWARKDVGTWGRVLTGTALIIGGLFGFLPILGFWMIPLGLILLAKDIPVLRGPVVRFSDWAERQWGRWKNQAAKKK